MPSGECHEAGKRFLKVMYYIMFIYFFGMYEKYFHLFIKFLLLSAEKIQTVEARSDTSWYFGGTGGGG